MHMRWFARRLISAIFMVIIFLPCINMLWIAHVETITWKNLTLVVYRLQAVWRIGFSKALEILLGTWKDCSQVVWELCLGLHLLLICSRGISLFFTETRGLRGQVQKLNLNGCSNGDEVFIFISIFFGGAGNFKFSCAMLVWPSPLSSQPLFLFCVLCWRFIIPKFVYNAISTMMTGFTFRCNLESQIPWPSVNCWSRFLPFLLYSCRFVVGFRCEFRTR